MTKIISVPIKYSKLGELIPNDQEIIYSSPFKLSKLITPQRSIHWLSHVILTNKSVYYFGSNGVGYYTDWGGVRRTFKDGFHIGRLHFKVYYDNYYEDKKDFKARKKEFQPYIRPFYLQRKKEYRREKYEAELKKKEEKKRRKLEKKQRKEQKKLEKKQRKQQM
ncbi:MAG: hypothetical protein P8Y70_15095 [Candidatus Lokiarchaeota archaeon]